MSLIDISGLTKSVGKLGSAVVLTVQPVANLIEMGSASSLAWSESHARKLAAKVERQTTVDNQVNRDLLRRAIFDADEATIETNAVERAVQLRIKEDSVAVRIHKVQCSSFDNIPDEVIVRLAGKANLTSADILREAKIGSIATPVVDETDAPTSAFNLSNFE